MSDESSQTQISTTAEVTNSVLKTVKSALGVGTDYAPFDAELIVHINSVFSTLHQLGVGPETPYMIFGESNQWSEFIQDNDAIHSVKTYVYARVRLIFDPPTTSFAINAFENLCKELEWRLRVQGETP